MKKRLSKSLSIIGIFLSITTIVIIFIIIKVRGDDKINSNSGSNIDTLDIDTLNSNTSESDTSDIDTSERDTSNIDTSNGNTSNSNTPNSDTGGGIIAENTNHNVSDGGATLFAYNSVPDSVVEGAKKYIREIGCDSSELEFRIINSRVSGIPPKYIVENVLDVYDPKELTKEYTESSTDYPYYVQELYKRTEDSNYISVGYFAINENGEITEAKYLKTAEELSSYIIELDIVEHDSGEGFSRETAATIQARKLLSLDETADVNGMCSIRFFYYDEDGNAVLCYRYRFDDGNEIYFNGITGEKIK